MQINFYINFWKKFFFYKERKGLEGFSLVELVIVLAVLSVLAAIALPSFTSVRVFLDETEAQVLAKNVLKSITMYQAKYGSFPTSWTVMAEGFFPDLKYCVYEKAISRTCGTGVGIPVSTIDPIVNPMNCIVITQSSYEMCGRRAGNEFQIILREMSDIQSPSGRKSISGCLSSLRGGRVIKQQSRDEVWISCNNL